MAILSGQTIRRLKFIEPFCERTVHENGMSFGLSHAGYDIRTKDPVWLPRNKFTLVCSTEHFDIPNNVLGRVTDKSTLARRGLAVQNTVLEPGWNGYLTLELSNHSNKSISLNPGSPIAQIIFEFLDEPAETPYRGKYQHQPDHAVGPRYES